MDTAIWRTNASANELLRQVTVSTMMHVEPQLLDVVALLSGIPDHDLMPGQVGTVVELLDGALEVEFSDDPGQTYAQLAVKPDEFLVLHHRPRRAA